MPTPTAGLRERKKSQTRRAIAAVALELALEQGPDAITVDDIAAAADVSPRTVFNYFGSKDEAILGIDPDRRAELCAEVARRPADETPLEALATVLIAVTTSNGDAGRVWRERSRLVAQHPHLRAGAGRVHRRAGARPRRRDRQRVGLPGDDAYCRLVVSAALAVSRGTLAEPDLTSNATLRRRMEEGFATLARGLTPPPPSGGRR